MSGATCIGAEVVTWYATRTLDQDGLVGGEVGAGAARYRQRVGAVVAHSHDRAAELVPAERSRTPAERDVEVAVYGGNSKIRIILSLVLSHGAGPNWPKHQPVEAFSEAVLKRPSSTLLEAPFSGLAE